MTIGLLVLLSTFAILLFISSTIQLLYLEALRIRTRESPALEYFKETLEDRFGLKAEKALISLSLVKHGCLILIAILTCALTADGAVFRVDAVATALLAASAIAIVAAHIGPQVIYRRSTGRWLQAFVPICRGLFVLVMPLTWALLFFQSLFDLGGDDRTQEDEPDSAEHIEALIEAGAEEGILEEDDRKLIQSVVAFGDKTVREVMTPRPSMVTIAEDAPLEQLRELAIQQQYSRLPVFGDSIDDIKGFVHVRDMFELSEHDRSEKKVRDILRPVRIVPEAKPVNDLLREMQNDGAHMAIVVNEYGNTAGLVTLEDMVEEIVGEIRDEHEPDRDVTEGPDGTFVVSGSYDIGRLRELIDFRPQEDPESTTVGGLVQEWLGHVPRQGETVERDGIVIQVLASSGLRVDQVRVSKAANGAAE
ncbi:MAG: hemolysin family protein [Bryobacteraceae bacterium]